MTDATAEPVLYSSAGAVATITLNRPDRLNAIDGAMANGLLKAAREAERDDRVRAVVLRGAGGGFMAGGDIRVFRDHLGRDLDQVILDITHDLHAAIVVLRRTPKPVVASVHGPCAGAGFSTAIACDLVIAADSAFFTMAYSRLGASPDGSSTYFLPRLVGLHKALELAFLSERLSAEQARALGLVNFVVAEADLAKETAALADRLARGPTLALGRAKALINRSLESSLEAQLEAEAQNIKAASFSSDFAEGVAAFLDKREPRFRGE